MKKLLSFILIGVISLTNNIVYADDSSLNESVYMPTWMQSNSVIVYDENLDCNVIEGGELSPQEISEREDIELIGLENHSDEMLACRNTKVVYDTHGFIQNVYYLVPGTDDQYQLANPMSSRVRSGVMGRGESYSYGSYMNYDTGTSQSCNLRRSSDGVMITGTGRITFYDSGSYGEAGTHRLQLYDCATKMYLDDVRGGTQITARNTYANKWHYYYKYDVGSLPNAILDIWSDGVTYPITDITTNGRLDNVYSGAIEHRVLTY